MNAMIIQAQTPSITGGCLLSSLGWVRGSTKAFVQQKELAYQTSVEDLKTSVSEGKSLVAAAVTDKGVSTAADATFQTIATNIGRIKTSSTLSRITTYTSSGSYDDDLISYEIPIISSSYQNKNLIAIIASGGGTQPNVSSRGSVSLIYYNSANSKLATVEVRSGYLNVYGLICTGSSYNIYSNLSCTSLLYEDVFKIIVSCDNGGCYPWFKMYVYRL